jgi:peptide deformylase
MLNIIVAGSKESSILNKACYPVRVNEDKIAADMIITCLKEVLDASKDAAGLAAPQIGFNIQIVMIHKSVVGKDEHLVLINPEVKIIGPDVISDSEGCLSFPGLSKKIKRAKNITVSTLLSLSSHDRVTLKLSELAARVVQHEVDHLNGVTILNK